MTRATPEEVALVVAAYACKYSKANLLEGRDVVTSAYQVVLVFGAAIGVCRRAHVHDSTYHIVSSGVALAEAAKS